MNLKGYMFLRKKLQEHVNIQHFKERVVSRHFTIVYSGLDNVKAALLRDKERALLTIDPESGTIIIGVGPYKIVPTQYIYGNQPYLHVEYKMKCLTLEIGAVLPLDVVQSLKNKMTGTIFGCIHGLVPNCTNDKSNVGKTIEVTVEGLYPAKRSVLECQPVSKAKKRTGRKDKVH